MSLGSAVRSVLGDGFSQRVGYYYRAVFVDLAKVARSFSAWIPANSHLLDVGGGDGAPLNYLLALRPDVRVTTIDVAPQVGQWLDPKYAARVVRMPHTDIGRYLATGQSHPDVILLSDVMHHIAVSERDVFLASLSEIIRLSPEVRIIVKDVEPGYVRSLLGYWADKYISGDKTVSPIAREDLISLMRRNIGTMRYEETDLFSIDKPNYALVFFKK